MTKSTLLLLSLMMSTAFLLGLASSRPPTTAPPIAEVVSEEVLIKQGIVNPSVLIMRDSGSGSGVVIYQDKKHAYILTANHVTIGSLRFWARQAIDDSIEYEELKVVYRDVENDMAILESPPVWKSAAQIISGDSDIKAYAKAFVYGFPTAVIGPTGGTLTEGRISNIHDIDIDENKQSTVATANVCFGNSGGGLFIQKDGHFFLAGIARCMGTARHGGQIIYLTYMGGFSTGEQMLNFLKVLKQGK